MSGQREQLRQINGQRMRFEATVERFGVKSGWRGSLDRTILLKNVRFAADGATACDHLWFTTGEWSCGLEIGHTFEFDARVDSYMRGYQGRRAERLGLDYLTLDYHLTRPTKVSITRKTRQLKKAA